MWVWSKWPPLNFLQCVKLSFATNTRARARDRGKCGFKAKNPNRTTMRLFGRFTATNSLNIGLPPTGRYIQTWMDFKCDQVSIFKLLTMDKILNLTLPEPLNRGADQILRFCVPPKRGSEKHSNRYTLPPVVKITMPRPSIMVSSNSHTHSYIFFS